MREGEIGTRRRTLPPIETSAVGTIPGAPCASENHPSSAPAPMAQLTRGYRNDGMARSRNAEADDACGDRADGAAGFQRLRDTEHDWHREHETDRHRHVSFDLRRLLRRRQGVPGGLSALG